MKLNEMRQAVELLANEWDLGKASSKAKGNVCAWIYLLEILEGIERMVIEKDNDKLIGFCGYSKRKSKKYIIKKKIYHIIKIILTYSPFIKDKKAIIEYNNDYNYTPIELQEKFDGEISIIILDKNYRGRGLGKKMLKKIFKYAEQDDVKCLKILTDESCNFKFYESLGCNKVYEKTIPNREVNKCGDTISEQGYIYEKKLNLR